MTSPVRKAVFPVAGLGTRFLPATKANPKEMLPIVCKPLIQYAVEEAVAAGITQLIFVTSGTKRAIEDHFDANVELEARLTESHQCERLALIQDIVPPGVDCVYIRQPKALGLGHAVYCAHRIVGNEPFAVLLADDLIQAQTPCLQQMVAHRDATGRYPIATQRVPSDQTHRYGIVSATAEGLIQHVVEKPAPTSAPSNQAIVGRYLLPPSIFKALATQSPGSGGEIQLTDAIVRCLADEPFDAFDFEGERFDCGVPMGYVQATIAYALADPSLSPVIRDWALKRLSATEVKTVINDATPVHG